MEVPLQCVQFYKSADYAAVFGDDQAVSNVSPLAATSFLTTGRKTRRGPLDGYVGKPTGHPTEGALEWASNRSSPEGGGFM